MPVIQTGHKATNDKKKATSNKAAGPNDTVRDDELNSKIEQIKAKEASANKADVIRRFEIAEMCRDIVEGDGNHYGSRAVEKASEALGWDPTWFLRQAAVPARWSKRQFEQLAAKTDRHGITLNWSHFVELARIKDDERRDRLVKTARDDGLSVSDLKKRIKADAPPQRVEDAPAMTQRDELTSPRGDHADEIGPLGQNKQDNGVEPDIIEDEHCHDPLFATEDDDDDEIDPASDDAPETERVPIDAALEYFESSGEIDNYEEFAWLEFISNAPSSCFTDDQLTQLQVIAYETRDKVERLLNRTQILATVLEQIESDRAAGEVAEAVNTAAA